jgi:hypothetical protein
VGGGNTAADGTSSIPFPDCAVMSDGMPGKVFKRLARRVGVVVIRSRFKDMLMGLELFSYILA